MAMADLTLADLRLRLEHDVEHAEAALLKDGLLAPVVALTTSDGTLLPVVPDFSSAETKAASMTAVRLLAIAEDAVIATHMSEVWMVVGQPTPDVSPSESERRIEAVAVVVQGRVEGEVVSLSSVREILRGDDGHPTGSRALDLPGTGREGLASLEGPMAELLPPTKPNEVQQVVARAALMRMGLVPAS